MAGAAPRRRSTPRSCSSRTTAGSWRRSAPRCWSWRPGARASSRALARLAQGEGGARAGARPRDRASQQAEIERLERFVERFRAGTRARQAQSRVKRLDKIERIERDPRDGTALGVRVQAAGARAAAWSSSWRTGASRSATATLLDDAELWLERGEHVVARRPQRLRQDDADRDARRRRARSTAASCARGHNVKLGYLSQHAEELGDDGHGARGGAARDRADAEQGARAARPVPVLRRGGREAARRAVGRRAPAAVAGDPRALGRQRADPRRADEPPRPREPRGARGRAARLPRLGAARLPRPRAARRGRHAHGRGRGRHAAQLRRRLGRVRARARGARARRERDGQAAPSRAAAAATAPAPPTAASRPARRTQAARRSGWSARSRRPRRRCRRSRTSWPTRRRGPTRARRRVDRAPRRRPSARSRSSTRAKAPPRRSPPPKRVAEPSPAWAVVVPSPEAVTAARARKPLGHMASGRCREPWLGDDADGHRNPLPEPLGVGARWTGGWASTSPTAGGRPPRR